VIDVDSSVTDVVDSSLLQSEVSMGANQFTENSVSHLDLPSSSGVYMITDKVSGVRYIGSSKNIRRRVMQHFSAMKTGKDAEQPTYKAFSGTYITLGPKGFGVEVLLFCAEQDLVFYEARCVSVLGDVINKYLTPEHVKAYSEEECKRKGDRVRKLWATQEYRERAVAARKGNAYSKGYKCTPEQVQNRKKAGRISNMKRNYGLQWKEEYIKRYPEHARDVDGY
jgi:hypothetical protein